MKLHSPKDMGQVAGVCCRQSPLRGAIGGLIVGAVFIGNAFLWWHLGAHWLVWGGCAALAVLFVPVLIRDALAKFRSTNWLLQIDPDGLWINLRSYQNRHLAEAATVLHLNYKQVARAHRHMETWSTPGTEGGLSSTHWKEESLELHLASSDTGEIARALTDERGRKPPVRGFLRVASKGSQQSVTVPAEGVIRIAWRGHGRGHDVVPSLARVLEELNRQGIELADPIRTDRPDWRELSGAELDKQIAMLVRSGDRIEATQLLVRRLGCSTTEAHKLVEELDTRI